MSAKQTRKTIRKEKKRNEENIQIMWELFVQISQMHL